MPICPRGHESQAEDWCDFCGFPMTPPPGLAVPGTGTLSGPAAPPAAPSHPAQPAHPGQATHPGQPTHPGQAVSSAGPTAALPTCPICRTPQTGRYCEDCGYDYDLSAASGRQQPRVAPPAPAAAQGGYGFPPPPVTPYQQPAAFPEPEGLEGTMSGPVYAQPGPTAPGDEFGTFHLQPPTPATPPTRTTWMAVVAADRDYFADMMERSGPEAAGLYFPPYCPERRIPLTGRGQIRIGRRSQHRGTVPEIDLSVPPEDPGASHNHAMLAEQPDGSWVLVDQDSTNGTTVNGEAEPVPPHTPIPLNDGDRIHIGAWTTITVHRS